MKFIDLHCDTASLLLETKQKLKQNSLKVDIQKLQQGEAIAQFFAMYIDSKEVDSSYEYCVKMLDNFKNELLLNQDSISLCRNHNDLIMAQKENKIGAFLSIEEGEAIEGSLDKLRYFKEQGISLITLTWNYENALGYSNFEWRDQTRGLKKRGFEVVEEMNHLDMLIDVSHLSDAGFQDLILNSKSPIIATHSNSRTMTNNPRNLSDTMLKQLADKGGITGINFFNNFLVDGELKEELEISTIADMTRHIKHIRNVAGVDVIALGSDFDGILNSVEIEDISHMYKLSDALYSSGFSSDEVEKIFYKNSMRIIKDVLK
ncbi:MAG TPA: membrane dipeptidase [Campylobacterales bacterium]|nr:membrane dipeptidase [Campylobacterales bacterium]